MRMTIMVLTAALALPLSGSAFAQTATGESSVKSPGSAKSEDERRTKRTIGSAPNGPADSTDPAMGPGEAGDLGPKSMSGNPAEPKSGNAATGGGAAPTGK